LTANHIGDKVSLIHQPNLEVRTLEKLTMPKFVIEREIPNVGDLSDGEFCAVAQKSMRALREIGPQIQWLHSYVTGNKIYCVYLAPDEATIQNHANKVGVPANRISAVRRMLDPTTAE
jgi:hypothetical protein